MDITIVLASLLGAITTAIMSLMVAYRQRLEKRKKSILQKEFSESLGFALNESFGQYLTKSESTLTDADKPDYILRDLRNNLVHFSTLKTKTDIEEQVNAKIDELKKRIEAIESRFPQEAILEKIASVNDAILATQMETISDSIKAIQNSMLTKWDVAKIVFAILSALGVLVGLIFGIITLVK